MLPSFIVLDHLVNATDICGRSRDELYLHSSGGVDKNNVDLRRPGVVDGLHGDAGGVFAVALLVELNWNKVIGSAIILFMVILILGTGVEGLASAHP